jgi:hypothetical protein
MTVRRPPPVSSPRPSSSPASCASSPACACASSARPCTAPTGARPGLPVALATLGGLRGGQGGWSRRLAGAALGAVAAAAVADDLGGGSRWFRRRLLPERESANVLAELGDPDAERSVLVTAHHDAAHSGLIFPSGARGRRGGASRAGSSASTRVRRSCGGSLRARSGRARRVARAARAAPRGHDDLRRLHGGDGRHRPARGRPGRERTTSPVWPCCCRSQAP